MRWSNLRWGEILPGWDVSIHVQMIWYYKLNYIILPRSHSGETSHQSGMILVIQEAPKRLLTWDETSHRSGISHLSRIAAEWWISFYKNNSFIWEWFHLIQVRSDWSGMIFLHVNSFSRAAAPRRDCYLV